MPRYIDPKYNPKIIYMGMDKLGNEIYHVPPDLPTVDVVDKELYDRLLENSIIISDALNKYQSTDMVEVVRCKYCEYLSQDKIAPEFNRICRLYGTGKQDYGFCDEGKRIEDGI